MFKNDLFLQVAILCLYHPSFWMSHFYKKGNPENVVWILGFQQKEEVEIWMPHF